MSLRAQTFEFQIKRLAKTFGPHNFPGPKCEEFYAECSDLTDEEFQRVVTRIIGEVRVDYPPTIIDFRERAAGERSKRATVVFGGFHMDSTRIPSGAHADSTRDRSFGTSEEALSAVNKFWTESVAIESFPEELRTKDAFFKRSKELFPDLHSRVSSLRMQVKMGSLESRTLYVEAATKLIRDTVIKTVIKGMKTVDEAIRSDRKAGA